MQLLKADEEISNIYLKYTETYREFSINIRKKIKCLIDKSFSPYSYEDSKILYSVNSHANPAELIQYDIEKFQLTKVNINLPTLPIRDEASVVQLPNNELFCFGKSDRNRCHAWIIDLNSYQIKRTVPSILYSSKSGIFYYKSSVYIIGGRLPWVPMVSLTNYVHSSIIQETICIVLELFTNIHIYL
ncbi:unnamed protein product [Blepharisma stoltei]|uniref:Uncharacterized protein n=1 Tax=Blepharisma stoltei TaxID=1481888 RepID=A0AAU9I9S0_9CILI|nr:unnamed protein product [Blepharisma stoltei]